MRLHWVNASRLSLPPNSFKSKDYGWIIFIFCDNDGALQHDGRLCGKYV